MLFSKVKTKYGFTIISILKFVMFECNSLKYRKNIYVLYAFNHNDALKIES